MLGACAVRVRSPSRHLSLARALHPHASRTRPDIVPKSNNTARSLLFRAPHENVGKTDGSGATRVLLCRRGIEPRVGKWGFPQGFMELGESTRDGAARETAEEAGATVVPGPLLAVYNLPGQVQLLYLAEVVVEDASRREPGSPTRESGDPPPMRCGIETLEAQFFALDELPEGDELAFPTVAWALEFARDGAEKALARRRAVRPAAAHEALLRRARGRRRGVPGGNVGDPRVRPVRGSIVYRRHKHARMIRYVRYPRRFRGPLASISSSSAPRPRPRRPSARPPPRPR